MRDFWFGEKLCEHRGPLGEFAKLLVGQVIDLGIRRRLPHLEPHVTADLARDRSVVSGPESLR